MSSLRSPRVLRRDQAAAYPVAPIVACPDALRGPEARARGEHHTDPLEQAYQAGFEHGREVCVAQLDNEERAHRRTTLEDLAKQLTHAATQVAENRALALEETVSEATELVFELLRAVLGEELELREDPARLAIARALQLTPRGHDLLVRLHPKSGIAAWELQQLVPGRRVIVEEDESVESSSCVVEVGPSRIDLQIAPALERVRVALAQLRKDAPIEEIA